MKKNYFAIIFFIATFIAIALFFSNCGSKYYVKKAAKLEKTNQYAEAAELYYNAFKSNKKNMDAYAGLKRAGQKRLNSKLEDFEEAYNEKDNKKACYIYDEARRYYRLIKKVGVELDFPRYYEEQYEEARSQFLEKNYEAALNLINSERFAEAEKALNEIKRLDKNYKDVDYRLSVAINEPKYRVGVNLMEERHYRKAYWEFKGINNRSSYKESSELERECLEKGTIRVCVLKVDNKSNKHLGYDLSTLKSNLVSKLSRSSNPFLKIVDCEENSRSKEKTLYFLKSEITAFEYSGGSLKEEFAKGYIREIKVVKNKQTGENEAVKVFKKVYYKTSSRKAELKLKVSFKLVYSVSQEIVKIQTKEVVDSDYIHYATYDGKTENLFPGTWESRNSNSTSDHVYADSYSKGKLDNLLKARKQIRPQAEMMKDAFTKIEEVIIKGVENSINDL